MGGECVGVVAEQVDAEGTADGEELLGVDAGFVEEFLEGARGDADAVGEPLVGVARAAQFVADKVADVDLLHGGCRCCAGYRIHIPTTAEKKRRRAISSPVCGRRNHLLWIDKMLACRRAFAHCHPQK